MVEEVGSQLHRLDEMNITTMLEVIDFQQRNGGKLPRLSRGDPEQLKLRRRLNRVVACGRPRSKELQALHDESELARERGAPTVTRTAGEGLANSSHALRPGTEQTTACIL